MLVGVSAALLAVLWLFGTVNADEGFINLDNAATSAEARQRIVPHRFTDAVRHEPSSFQRHTQHSVELVATDALLLILIL